MRSALINPYGDCRVARAMREHTYASSLNPEGFEGLVEQKFADSYNAFKIKNGFHREMDFVALNSMQQTIGERRLMVDVNQGWTVETACDNWLAYSDFDLQWIEKPLAADRPLDEWQQIAALGGAQIAAGENMLRETQFDSVIDAGGLGVVQPDICKWCGFSKVLSLA